jgi:hypothetical protein
VGVRRLRARRRSEVIRTTILVAGGCLIATGVSITCLGVARNGAAARPVTAAGRSLGQALRTIPASTSLQSIERALRALPKTDTLSRLQRELAALPGTTLNTLEGLTQRLPPATTVAALEHASALSSAPGNPTSSSGTSSSGTTGSPRAGGLAAAHPGVPPSGTSSASGTAAAPPGSAGTAHASIAAPHVMVIMMENKNFSEVVGQADQPYTNSLANSYGLATNSYAFGHPSLPNYLEIASGSSQGVTDDNPPSSHSFSSTATLADQLAAAGFSAKAYAENVPSDPRNDAGEYAVRHVPWEYFPHTPISVTDSSALVADLNSPVAPDFVWYTPNLIHDEHDGTPQQGDAFLASLIPSVQATAWYRANGRIIVEWDEADTDNTGLTGGDGGHVPTIVVSAALATSHQRDSVSVDTAGVLHSIEDVFGLGYLGAAADPANGNIDALLR